MKRLAIALLLSSFAVGHSFCETNDTVGCAYAKKYVTKGAADYKLENDGITSDKACASNSIYMEITRTTADDETWQYICKVVEECVPASKAKQIGQETDTLSCTIKRGDLSDQDWILAIKSVLTRAKDMVRALQANDKCRGANVRIVLDRIAE